MPTFSKISKARLATCHNELQALFSEVIKYYDCTIVCGHRGKDDQERAFIEKKSKVHYPASKHNSIPSLAVDAASYEIDSIDWTPRQAIYFTGYVKGVADQLFDKGIMMHRIRIGADWDGDNDIDDQTFNDYPHFELIV
ncbi:MAG: peptidase [Bacteroidetes bacterium GWF2_42_66]|nr:MAG: peptidase [Bacteroidetes bacterium GWA2_42_15]OFY01245.1 MAG: peptidase [Bacteroidetes bacterium GWE2_42_39]OFY42088.1 MAG: peptidase [Bacteroidetes bacterium GWF2_42_66]HBL77709.1 peptidase [Prolixibacteraceae bacterium]HCB62838.1 peptidase [Bacteroidales bacterium]